jgi:nucleoside-diphosphate-sugar epimerase
MEDLDMLIKDAEKYAPFDQIYHLATVGVRPEFNDIELICDVNIKMGCKIINFAKKNNSKLFINFGSCFEYGDHGESLLTEDMDCYPESLYAISKNASTNLMTGYAKNQNVKMITVRPFGVFGNGESSGRLAPSIIRSCMNGQEVKTTEGNQIRDFVNVKDVVKAIIQLANANYIVYEIYNICSDNPVKVKDFITEIIEVCGFDKSLVKFGALPYRQNEAMVFAGNNKKLQDVINYPFPLNHKEGIIEIYNSICVK